MESCGFHGELDDRGIGPRREKAKVKLAALYRNHGRMGNASDAPFLSDSEPNELVRLLRLEKNKCHRLLANLPRASSHRMTEPRKRTTDFRGETIPQCREVRDVVRVAGLVSTEPTREDQQRFLNILGQLPARLTAEQTAWVLNCQAHDVPVLVAARLLKPLGTPQPNSVK